MPEESALVLCSSCNTPMKVVFGEDGEVKKVFAVCKCPREVPSGSDDQ